MNTILSGSIQVKDPAIYKEFTAGISDKASANEPGRYDSMGLMEASRRFDFSRLSGEEKSKLYEEIEKHNKEFAFTGKYLKFRYDEEAETSIVDVIDTSTNEVIVSLPPEFLIDLSIKMKKILGIYIDEKL